MQLLQNAVAAQQSYFSIWLQKLAEWQSGYAAACKAVDAGSIPTSASSYAHTNTM